jgi:uncharacterized protein (TIGR00156 family)
MHNLLYMAVLTAVIGLASPLYAGGFVGPSHESGKAITSSAGLAVKEILKNPIDDMHVTLRGHILKKISHEKYIFSDGTGEIKVEMGEHRFPDATITPETRVEIHGEVCNDFHHHGKGARRRINGEGNKEFVKSTYIDVKTITIVTPDKIK